MTNNEHLSRIETLWSVVRQAHEHDPEATGEACTRLIERYGGAIRRYLMASLRDTDAVDEVFQEFSLRFVRGDFRNASPDRGRFRSFLKTVIYHLIADYGRSRKRHQAAALEHESLLAADHEPQQNDADARFHDSWRDHLLTRTWQTLQSEEETSGKPWHTTLRCRADHPELRSAELAELVSSRTGRDVSTANVRVLVHRARERFAEILIAEVSDSLATHDSDQLEDELVDLNLWHYCKPLLRPES